MGSLGARGHVAIAAPARPSGDVASGSPRPWDLTDVAATERLIAETEPDWVFCAAALTHVDYCEDHPDEAFRVNRDAAAAAARLTDTRGGGFVYYSTDYVFDGTAGPYGEEDPVDPVSVYGRSKLEGERWVTSENPRTLVIRTTVVYGVDHLEKNFVYQLVRRGRGGERMTVPADQRSNPTYTVDLADASVELAERGSAGIWHVAGTEILDRAAFARVVCEVFDVDPALVVPVTTASLGQRARRPLRAGLRVDRARTALSTRLRGPREGLQAMREALLAGQRSGTE
jgi:dTDP-4-dehydrorhamnose reductase